MMISITVLGKVKVKKTCCPRAKARRNGHPSYSDRGIQPHPYNAENRDKVRELLLCTRKITAGQEKYMFATTVSKGAPTSIFIESRSCKRAVFFQRRVSKL